MGLFLVNRDICIWQHPNIAFIYSRHPHRHLFLLWIKLSMLVGPIVLCLTSMAWNLGHGPLPVRSGIHRRQADHPTSSRDRINKVTIKTLYTKLKTDWFCCCLIWSGIRFSVQTLSEALRCSEVIVKTFRQTESRVRTSLIRVEGHQTAAGFDVVALRREGTSSYICNPALNRETGVLLNQLAS